MSGPGGARFHGGKSGPLGLSSVKSANTGESPTGFRSRGPSAERQARVLRRRALTALANELDRIPVSVRMRR